MKYIINNGELYHYGVPGMRWGRKRGTVKNVETNDKASNKNKPKLDPVITQKHVKNTLTSVAVLAGTNATAAVLKAAGKKKLARIVRKYGSISSGMLFVSGLFNIGYTKATGGDKK